MKQMWCMTLSVGSCCLAFLYLGSWCPFQCPKLEDQWIQMPSNYSLRHSILHTWSGSCLPQLISRIRRKIDFKYYRESFKKSFDCMMISFQQHSKVYRIRPPYHQRQLHEWKYFPFNQRYPMQDNEKEHYRRHYQEH